MKVRDGILEKIIKDKAIELLDYLEDHLDIELKINPNNDKALALKNKIYCKHIDFMEMDFEDIINEFTDAGIKINTKPFYNIISWDWNKFKHSILLS